MGWWTSGSGGVGGRGRASTHGAFLWVGGQKSSVLNPTKKVFLSLLGSGGGIPGRGAEGRRVGGGPLVRGGRGGGWGRSVFVSTKKVFLRVTWSGGGGEGGCRG